MAGERFGIAVNGGFWEGGSAVAGDLEAVLAHNFFTKGDRVAITGGAVARFRARRIPFRFCSVRMGWLKVFATTVVLFGLVGGAFAQQKSVPKNTPPPVANQPKGKTVL